MILVLLQHESNGLGTQLIVHASQLKNAVETIVAKLSRTSTMLSRTISPNQLVVRQSNPCLKGSPVTGFDESDSEAVSSEPPDRLSLSSVLVKELS
jgi:hypothetical protein